MISEKKPDERSQNAVRGEKFGSAEGILSARNAERHPPALQRAVCSKETFGEGRSMPRPDRKAADSLTPRTRRANTEKPWAKAVRRTAGALKAGRSPGGAPAVMKDRAGAPARKKGSGTQRQSTRWEPEPERKAVCPGQSAT